MKVIGGSFGLKGSAYIAGPRLIVEAAQKASYSPEQVSGVVSRTEKERKFGIMGAVAGAVLLGALGTMFLGVAGAVIGIVVAIAGSFYSSTRNVCEVTFSDGKTLALECTAKAVTKLVKFAP